MNMKNILLKLTSLCALLICVFTLVACGSKPSKKLWDKYVKAVNNHDLAAVAECFTEPSSQNRESFATDHADYFDGLNKIKTVKYKETINCDFSNSQNTQAYFLAEIELLVNGSTTYNVTIYSYENNNGSFFCSYFKIEDGFTKNEPSDYWTDKAYYHTDEFLYKNYNTGTVYIEETKNLKKAVVPAEIDGEKLTTIGEYAFYQYTKMLSFTIPTSRLRELTIEEGVTTIGKYAFYQCKKLKTLVIPESMRYIDRMAFANCSGLERLEFQTRTKETGSTLENESFSFGTQNGEKLVITNAHNLQVGEIIVLGAELGDNKVPRVEWSSSSEIISINSSTGKIVANKAGRATVTATLVDNRAVSARVDIVINEIEAADCLKMYWDAFSRCSSIKEIYLHAYNPNSYIIDSGSNWLFNSTCKIYVPKGSREMYVNHSLWSKYADQIVEMTEDDAENTINIALSSVGLTTENAGDIYSAVNPNKVDNIIYLIQNGSKYDLVNAYVGSVILNNASANIIDENTSKEQLFKLFTGLHSELSLGFEDEGIDEKYLENHILLNLSKLDKIYEDYKEADYSKENYDTLLKTKERIIKNIENSKSINEANEKLLAGWKDSYNILKTGEETKPEKEYNLDDIVVTYEDTEEVKFIDFALATVRSELKKTNNVTDDKISVSIVDVVENETNPNVTIYRCQYKLTLESDLVIDDMYIYVNNGNVTCFDANYDGLYDLIKIVMASANKVEK